MDELLKGILIGLIPALVVSLATALITVRLSLRQFHSQRWWEKRNEAYSQIMEQLSYLVYYYNEWIDEDLGLTEKSEQEKFGLYTKYSKIREDLTRVAAMGSYIVAPTTSEALAKMLIEFRKTEYDTNFGAIVSDRYKLVQECIEIVRRDAKQSLQK
jgi:hypothetical protein